MSDEDTAGPGGAPQAPPPHPRLRDLDVLEGTWRVDEHDSSSGEGSIATVTRRWLPGGYFMVQETRRNGEADQGTEYIGFDFEADMLRSMLFSGEGPGPFCSFALEYFWDVTGDQLTIWHGHKDSPAKFTGTIDAGVIRGAWEWPGGGYEATATRTD